MSDSPNVVRVGGISTIGLLGIVFVTLKLLGVIDWSWWLVTLPFWGGIAAVMAIFVCVFIVALGAAVLEARK